MFASQFRVTTYGRRIDFYQAACFSRPIAFDDVLENGNDGFFRQSRVEKHRAATLGKGLFTNQTIKQPRVVRTVNVPNADISLAPNAVFGTIYILATKLIKIVHDRFRVG